jgi:hypothetical protein
MDETDLCDFDGNRFFARDIRSDGWTNGNKKGTGCRPRARPDWSLGKYYGDGSDLQPKRGSFVPAFGSGEVEGEQER